MSGREIIEGAEQALAIAQGEKPAARIFVAGHWYVPEAERDTLRQHYETAQANWDLTLDRAERAEAERDALAARLVRVSDDHEDWRQAAWSAEAERDALKAALGDADTALAEHNDALRSAYQASQRDAIAEIEGTTSYGLLADRLYRVLHKHHAATNAARARIDALLNGGAA